MSVISKDKNVIKIYYNSKSAIGKKALAYVDASYKDILAIDTEQTKVTGTQYAEISERLNCTIGDLVDKDHPKFKENYDKATLLSEDDWIKVLNESPEVLVHPIVIIGHTYYQIFNPSEIERFLDPNSQGLDEQNPN